MRGYAKQTLAGNDANSVRDVATAEMFLKAHEDFGYEIAAKGDDFKQLQELGAKLMRQKPNDEIKTLLVDLHTEKEQLHRAWQEKDNWLKQCKGTQDVTYRDRHYVLSYSLDVGSGCTCSNLLDFKRTQSLFRRFDDLQSRS